MVDTPLAAETTQVGVQKRRIKGGFKPSSGREIFFAVGSLVLNILLLRVEQYNTHIHTYTHRARDREMCKPQFIPQVVGNRREEKQTGEELGLAKF